MAIHKILLNMQELRSVSGKGCNVLSMKPFVLWLTSLQTLVDPYKIMYHNSEGRGGILMIDSRLNFGINYNNTATHL